MKRTDTDTILAGCLALFVMAFLAAVVLIPLSAVTGWAFGAAWNALAPAEWPRLTFWQSWAVWFVLVAVIRLLKPSPRRADTP